MCMRIWMPQLADRTDRLERKTEKNTVQVYGFHYQGFCCCSVSCRLVSSHAWDSTLLRCCARRGEKTHAFGFGVLVPRDLRLVVCWYGPRWGTGTSQSFPDRTVLIHQEPRAVSPWIPDPGPLRSKPGPFVVWQWATRRTRSSFSWGFGARTVHAPVRDSTLRPNHHTNYPIATPPPTILPTQPQTILPIYPKTAYQPSYQVSYTPTTQRTLPNIPYPRNPKDLAKYPTPLQP